MFNKIYDKIKIFIFENIKFLICLGLLVLALTYEFPFVVYTPGGLVNLEKRIEVDNCLEKDGSFNMSYVSMRKGTIPNILLSYIIPNWDLKKEEEVTQSDNSVDELLNIEKIYMEQSIDNATILAYQKADKSLTITKSYNYVTYIADFADTNIKLGDIIVSAEGVTINTIDDLRSILANKNVNDKINILVKRNNIEKKCYAYVTQVNDEKKIGIGFLTTYDYEATPKINVKTRSSESGSSGGLMLTLAIYNDLISDDLARGRTVVGTGTISLDGTVGAIDGVKYKMLGAKNADIFLCPEENYKEAQKIKKQFNLKFTLKSIKTFDEAVEYLLNN